VREEGRKAETNKGRSKGREGRKKEESQSRKFFLNFSSLSKECPPDLVMDNITLKNYCLTPAEVNSQHSSKEASIEEGCCMIPV
jgi:hypothetical protein